jgi:hypothetical protein
MPYTTFFHKPIGPGDLKSISYCTVRLLLDFISAKMLIFFSLAIVLLICVDLINIFFKKLCMYNYIDSYVYDRFIKFFFLFLKMKEIKL